MIRQKKLAASVILSCLLQSCTFSAPQVEVAFRNAQSLLFNKASCDEVLWLASYNDTGAVLRPYVAGGYTVFANESGDAIAFDGWVVRSVLGFGLEQALTISDDGLVRSSRLGEESFVAHCSQWQKDTTNMGFQWRQICGRYGHMTVIYIDEAGSIRRIDQTFGGDLGTLRLHLRR